MSEIDKKALALRVVFHIKAYTSTLHPQFYLNNNEAFPVMNVAEARALASMLGEAAEGGWRPTHRHKKRGSTYRVIGEAEAQVSKGGWKFPTKDGIQYVRPIQDGDRITIYQGEDGKLWARFTDEFNDGRFEAIHPSPTDKEG